MPNPFLASQEVNTNVPRATHDLSHQVNGTYAFGKLYPVLCQEVGEGFSVNIDKSVLGLRALPMVFPVQTPMRATIHYFYVRTRTLWKDWMDFKFNTKTGLSQPHTGVHSKIKFGTGELCDYLDVPTRVYGLSAKTASLQFPPYGETKCLSSEQDNYLYPFLNLDTFCAENNTTQPQIYPFRSLYASARAEFCGARDSKRILIPIDGSQLYSVLVNSHDVTLIDVNVIKQDGITLPAGAYDVYFGIADTNTGFYKILSSAPHKPNGALYSQLNAAEIKTMRENSWNVLYMVVESTTGQFSGYGSTSPYTIRLSTPSGQHFVMPDGLDISMLPAALNPYLNGQQSLLTYPFRAYESIFNAFYRNQQIDPLLDSQGRCEYNKYLTSDDGGEDNFPYDFHYKNWESDIFTSCLPSPQQGAAPIVGIVNSTDRQILAIQDDDGNVRYVNPLMSDDGKTLKSIEVGDIEKTDVKVLDMFAAPSQGITINDFRNVNALQKYLELNQRKGYRYKDLVKGHYDVDIRYDELMMPEFLGGISQDINVSTVMSTSDTSGADGSPLASYAGSATCIGTQGHSITKYCDEAGFIVGILCITPVPVYTQPLPRMFTRNHYLDYYTPEFANVGMQAIMKSQVSPLETFVNGTDTKRKDGVFGYQRPWSDYLRHLDTAHGLMRSQLRNFLINRVFDGVPQLGKQFIQVTPDHLNDVFASTLPTEDKFIGQIYFNIRVKSPVPYTWIPRLD